MYDPGQKKYQLFEMEDGTVHSSKDVMWRDLDWLKVIKITMKLRKKEFVFEKGDADGFVNIRYAGRFKEWFTGDDGKRSFRWRVINSWVVGLVHGNMATLTEVDWKTERKLSETKETLDEIGLNHIHPDLLRVCCVAG